jgi:hypothetical protein
MQVRGAIGGFRGLQSAMVAAGASQPVLNVPFIIVVVTVNAGRWADFGMGDILDGNARNWRMYPNLLSLRNSATLLRLALALWPNVMRDALTGTFAKLELLPFVGAWVRV